LGELGYGGRSVSIMGYYNYSDKRPDFPFSYSASLFSNNSQNYGFGGRFGYHFDDDNALTLNFLFQKQGGEEPINTSGFGLDFVIDEKKFKIFWEAYYVQDPIEGVIRRLQNLDENVCASGTSLTGSYEIDIDAEIVKKIEPVLNAGIFIPDLDKTENNVLQLIAGMNLYFHKKVMARLNGDIRFTKNEFNSDYSTNESRLILEIFVRF
jgi:hypothetical protein